jgi:DNA primase
LDFVGALKLLADRAGVILEDFPRHDNSEKEKLLAILELATIFFQDGLANSKVAKNYLLGRRLTDETITSWRIGFVPKDWRLLYFHLKEKGVLERDMEKAGLIKRSEKGGEGESGWYDVFRGRVIFPIFDVSGRVIAFSGRILEDDPKAPKYLNSPETSLFNKSETLYGLDRAKVQIRKQDYTILVEGQIDIVMCHQAGFSNTVASSGTAFTKEHLMKLQRLSNRLMLAYDSDKAGFVAANKSAVLALSLGLEVKIAELPKGSDPAEIIKNDIEVWKEALRNGKHLIDFYLDNAVKEKTDKRALGKVVEKKVLPYIAMLQSSIEQSHFVSQVSKKTGIRDDSIWNDLRKIPRGIPNETGELPKTAVDKETKHRKHYIEEMLVGIVLWQESKDEKVIDGEMLRIKMVAIAGDKYISELFRSLKDKSDELVFKAEAYYASGATLTKDADELLFNLEEDLLRERFVEAMGELQKAQEVKDDKMAAKLLVVCKEIGDKMSELSRRRIENNAV